MTIQITLRNLKTYKEYQESQSKRLPYYGKSYEMKVIIPTLSFIKSTQICYPQHPIEYSVERAYGYKNAVVSYGCDTIVKVFLTDSKNIRYPVISQDDYSNSNVVLTSKMIAVAASNVFKYSDFYKNLLAMIDIQKNSNINFNHFTDTLII